MALRHKTGFKLLGKSLVRPPPSMRLWVKLRGRPEQMGELLEHRLACWKLRDPARGGPGNHIGPDSILTTQKQTTPLPCPTIQFV